MENILLTFAVGKGISEIYNRIIVREIGGMIKDKAPRRGAL